MERATPGQATRASIDKRIYEFVSSQWGKSAILDALFRVLAAWTPTVMLAVIVIASMGYAWHAPVLPRIPNQHWLHLFTLPAVLRTSPLTDSAISLISAVLVRVINEPITHLFRRPRPFQESVLQPLLGHEEGGSFPSNHAAGAFALAFGFWANHSYLLILTSLATLLCLARVYTGLHYLTDVLAGAVNGMVVALLVFTVVFSLF